MRINNIAEFESVFTKVDELVEGSLSSVFNNVDIEIKNYGKKEATSSEEFGVAPLRLDLTQLLKESGWSTNINIFSETKEVIHFLLNDVAMQLSFGNHAMGYYDILKLRQAYEIGLAKFTILVSLNPKPIREYEISGSLVNFSKISALYDEFTSFLNFPIIFLELD